MTKGRKTCVRKFEAKTAAEYKMVNDSLERIRQVFEELNRPSKNRLATALKARGIAYTTKALDEVVGKSTEKLCIAWGLFFGFARVLCQVNGVTAPPRVNIWTRYLTFVFVGWRFQLLFCAFPYHFV